jgi:hypothetical protein
MLATALHNKNVALGKCGRHQEAVSACDNFIARFGKTNTTSMRERMAKTLYDKGDSLEQLGLVSDAIAIYDDIVTRFGQSKESSIITTVTDALERKTILLNNFDVIIAN